MLKQVHRVYGPVTVYVAPNDVRVESARGGFAFVCGAPAWDAVVYSAERKLVCRIALERWSKTGIKTALNVEQNDQYYTWPKVRVADTHYKGLKVARFEFPFKRSDGSLHNLSDGNVGVYMSAIEPKVAGNAGKFLCAVFDLPPTVGIPVFFSRSCGSSFGYGFSYNREQTRRAVLETQADVAVLKPRPQLFKVPAGLSPAAESDVVLSKSDLNNTYGALFGK